MPAEALKCKECSTTYPLDARYVCERCFGPLEVAYGATTSSADELRRRIQAGPDTLWRYADFLPLERAPRSSLPTGLTPLVRADRLAERLGLGELWIKNETANPTHSFKDRVVSVALARAVELGFDTVACASTGNLAGAVAAHAAHAGLPAYVFIPADLEPEKILSAGAYGATTSSADELRRRIQAGPDTLWRYADFLPLERAPRSSLPTGLTPLVRADRLAERLGLGELWIKNETANPTHSFKDRVVSVALARAVELGFDTVACASTGNLAGAVAAHAAHAGLPAYVFIPFDLEPEKILSAGAYGAQIVGVRGNYDAVNRLCTEVSGERESWAFVNVNMRPYYSQGSKTLAFETVEQLGWELPDRVVAPIASGSLFTKVAAGFREFIDAGLVAGSVPAMHGAQAEGCSPVAQAYAAGTDVCRPVRPDTIAKSLAIGNPADGPYAVELARSTDGSVEAVSDDEIRGGIRLLAETTGIFTETAGGVTIATLAKLAERGAIGAGERVVAYVTGDGLKTLDAVRGTFEVAEIEPRFEDFEAAVGAVL